MVRPTIPLYIYKTMKVGQEKEAHVMRKKITIIVCSAMLLYTVMLHARTDMARITKTYERVAKEFSHHVPEAYYCFDATILINHTL